MSIHKTEGIIIKTLPFRSSSLIVTFFSPQFGKIRGIVKGVHRGGEIRQAGYELFTHAEFIFYEKKHSDLHLVTESVILNSYKVVRNHLDGIAYASYFCELVDELTEVHDPHPKIFDILKTSLHYLSAISPERLAPLFEIKLLREMGWIPFLDSCLVCGAKPLEKGFFSVRQGALICEKCYTKDPRAQPVSSATLAVLRFYIKDDLDHSLRISHSALVENQIRMLIAQFLNFRLGKVLNSRRFIEAIKPTLKAS